MKTLGFATNLSRGGEQEPVRSNDGEWSRKVIDIRSYLQYFDGIDSDDHHVILMSFSSDGCYIALLWENGGRSDFRATWIYIPNDIIITNDDILAAYERARKDMREKIGAEIINKRYQEKSIRTPYTPSQNGKYAIRYYRSENNNGISTNSTLPTLVDIIGRNRYQEYYSEYERIFLLEEGGRVTIDPQKSHRFTDISSQKIISYTTIIPPTDNELVALGVGTTILFKNAPFTLPLRVKSGTHTFTLQRPGFISISRQLSISDCDEEKISFPKNEIKWQKQITWDLFKVYDEKSTKIEGGYKIKVYGKDITKQNVIIFEEECKNAQVEVSMNGYDTYKGNFDLISSNKQTINLRREMKSGKCQIKCADGHVAEIKVTSQYVQIDQHGKIVVSPIKGYEFETTIDNKRNTKKTDKLSLSGAFIFKQRAYGFLVAAAVAILVWLCIEISMWCNEHTIKWNGILPKIEKVRHTSTMQPPQVMNDTSGEGQPGEDNDVNTDSNDRTNDQAKTNDVSGAAAVKYLNNHDDKWTEEKLEQYELTRGLYDEMINYKFADIANRKIDNCPSFNGISILCDAKKDSIPANGEKYPRDGSITIDKWKKAVLNLQLKHK